MNDNLRLCECGRGRYTNLNRKGEPQRFIRGHNRTGRGKGWIEQGRRSISINGKKKALARHIVEQREGRTLGRNEIVHHADHNSLNDEPDNHLLLSRGEHTCLHRLKDKRIPWTEEEDERLLVLQQAKMPIQDAALILGRSYHSTQRRLAKLKRTGRGRAWSA